MYLRDFHIDTSKSWNHHVMIKASINKEKSTQHGTIWEITTQFNFLAMTVLLFCVRNKCIANNWQFVVRQAIK